MTNGSQKRLCAKLLPRELWDKWCPSVVLEHMASKRDSGTIRFPKWCWGDWLPKGLWDEWFPQVVLEPIAPREVVEQTVPANDSGRLASKGTMKLMVSKNCSGVEGAQGQIVFENGPGADGIQRGSWTSNFPKCFWGIRLPKGLW